MGSGNLEINIFNSDQKSLGGGGPQNYVQELTLSELLFHLLSKYLLILCSRSRKRYSLADKQGKKIIKGSTL